MTPLLFEFLIFNFHHLVLKGLLILVFAPKGKLNQKTTMSQHGSARPRHGYASPVALVTYIEPGKLLISDSFKRSSEDNLGILQAKQSFRRQQKSDLAYKRRSASKLRDNLRRREVLNIIDDYDTCVIEDEAISRSHDKRLVRHTLRAEHRELLKWKSRHSAFLREQQSSRKLIYGDFNSMFQNSDILLESDNGILDLSDEKELFVVRELTVQEQVARIEALYPAVVLEPPPQVDSKVDDSIPPPPSPLQFVKDHADAVLEDLKTTADNGEFDFNGFFAQKFMRNRFTQGRYVTTTSPDLSRFDSFVANVRDKTKNMTLSIKRGMDECDDYFTKLMQSPVFSVLRENCLNDFSIAMLDVLVSTLSFIRLSTQIPFSFLNISSLCWLYLRSLGFNRKSSLGMSAIVASLTTLVITFVELFEGYNRKNGIVLESYGSSIDGFLSGATNFLSHPLISAIRNIIIFMASLHLFEKPVASEIYKHLGKPEGFSILSLIMTALNDISTMIKMGEVWLFGKPGSVDLLSENPLTSAVARITNQIDMSEFVYCGLPIEGYIERNTYINELKEKVENLTQAIAISPKVDVRRLKADVKLREAQKLLHEFFGAAVSGFRATPLGVIVHGNPGVGKSHVLKFICHIHSVIKGRMFKEEFIYTRNGEFWEGYAPFSHPYVHYPEAGKKKSSQALSKGDETMDELLAVIDNLSFPVNMAFKDKGKIFALPEMVIIDTNNSSLNLDQLYENPAAFRRRFLYVEPSVVAQYSTTGEVGGDFDKEAKGAAEAGTDAWVFNVYTMSPKDNLKSIRKDLLVGGTATELIETLTPIFVKHILYEEAILKRIANGGMFGKHDQLILKCARLAGAISNGKAVIQNDGSVQIHPDSVYMKMANSELRKEASDAFHSATLVVRNFIDHEIRMIHVDDDDDGLMASVVGASVTNVQDGIKDMQNLIPEPSPTLNIIQAAHMNDVMGASGRGSTNGDKIASALEWPIEKFIAEAPKEFTLSDVACFLMTEWDDEDITNYAYSLGMFRFLRIVCDRNLGRLTLEKRDIFGTWRYNDIITFTADSIVLKKSPIFNWAIGVGNGWTHFWNAHDAMTEASDDSNLIEPEYIDGATLLLTFPSLLYYLWVTAFFFACKLTLSQNLKWNFDLSSDRICFMLFSFVCCWFQCYSIWIGFMVFFFTCLSIRDNFRHQGLEVIQSCISDGLDGLGFNFVQAKSIINEVPEHTPRRNFWKLKAVGAFVGVALAVVTTAKLLTVTDKKKSDEPSITNQNVNVSVVNGNCSTPPSPIPSEKIIIPSDVISESVFSKISEHDTELLEREKSYHCGQSISRIPNKLDPEKWNVRVIPPPKYTGDSTTFVKKIGYNCRGVVALGDGFSTSGLLMGLWDNFAVMHGHAFRNKPLGRSALISTTGYQNEESVKLAVLMDEQSFRPLPNDLILVRCNQVRFSDVRSFIPKKKFMPRITTAFIGIDETAANYLDKSFEVTTKHGVCKFSECYEYHWNKHAPGRCGTPLIGQVGKGWVLLGVHSGATRNKNDCIASILDIDSIMAAAADMEKHSLFSPLCSANLESLSTVEPGSKSVTRFVEMHGSIFHGKLPGNVIMPSKSKVMQTGLNTNNEIDNMFEEILGHQCTTEFGPPPMRGFFKDGTYRDPDVLFASKVSLQKQPLERKIVERCIKEYSQLILDRLTGLGRESWQPWDIDTAINGAVDDAYSRAMDLNKASGFGRKGKKSAFFEVEEKTSGKWAEMLNDLRRDVLDALKCYESGTSPLVFFEACLKDEPRDVKKCDLGKTRTFCVSPLVNLIISRMFFGPFYSTMVERGDIFCVAIGTDMHRHAHDLYTRLGDWSHLILELDYGNYDQTMPYEIGWAAGSVVYQVCKKMGYSGAALKILSGLISDNLHPFVVLKQDVFELPGYQPSGKYGTAEDNSIRGVLMLMYIWYHPTFHTELGHLSFFDKVLPYVYGDDVVAAVKQDVSVYYNNLTYSSACEMYLGLGCTPASKGAEFTPFVELDTMMFLKRKFRKHKEFERVVAPLDLDSLMKTLSWHIPSNSISAAEQVEAAVDSVVRELFFHCDLVEFTKITERLYAHAEGVFKVNRGSYRRLSYYDLAYATLCITERPVVMGRQDNETKSDTLGYETSYDKYSDSLVQESAPVEFSKCESFKNSHDNSSDHVFYQGTEIDNMLSALRQNLKHDITILNNSVHTDSCVYCQTFAWFDSLLVETYTERARHISNTDISRKFDSIIRAVEIEIVDLSSCPEKLRVDSVRSTLDYVERVFRSKSLGSVILESAELNISADNSTEMKHENLRDVSGDVVSETPMAKSFTNFSMRQTDVELRKYLSRPLLLSQGAMVLDTPFSLNLDAYNLLLRNGDVRAKLRNFAFFRADLCIKVTVSATPFHQGRIIAAWLPWYNNCPSSIQAMTYVSDTFLPNQYLSTCPIQKTIDLKSNMPIELKIPFMHPQPMGRLFNNTALVIPATSDFDDFVDIGRFFMRSINVPESVSATATNPYYQIYAWFENITYTTVTGTKMDIKLESDERIVGPVEKWSSAASEVFDALSSVPIIAPFAVPSAMISKGIRDVSAHAGWSRPSTISDPTRMRNEVFTCASHYVGADLSHKLAFDPKQEVTIDPSPLGVGLDEMVLSHLCAKEQLLDTADYRVSSVVNEPFWSCAVHPRVVRKSGIDLTAIPSPMALVSSYFGYWHGDITFRFDVVKTTFHKGKFAVFWDPNLPQANLINASLKFNSEYLYIVDLQELDDLEVTVKWNFPQAWASVTNSANSRRSIVAGPSFTGLSPNFGLKSCNGYISLMPITSLQSPLDKSVHINVYIKSENMHFNVISTVTFEQPWVFPAAAAKEADEKEIEDVLLESNDVSDLMPVKIIINTNASEYGGISCYHFGEEPLSWRSMLKRYRTYARGQLLGVPFGTITAPIVPPLDPPNGSSVTTYTDGGFLGVMRRCFIGIKGGFKYRIRSASTVTTSQASTLPGNTAVVTMLGGSVSNSAVLFAATTDGAILDMQTVGSSAFVPFTQPGLEFEVPFYSTCLFHFSQLDDPLPSKSYMDSYQFRNWRFACFSPTITSTNYYVDGSSGEDFMLMHFLSAPMMRVS